MGAETVLNHPDSFGTGPKFRQFFHKLCVILTGAVFRYSDHPLSCCRFDSTQNIAHAIAFIMAINPLRHTRFRRQRHDRMVGESDRLFIEAYLRFIRIVRFGTEIRDVLHPAKEFAVQPTDAPLPSLPRPDFAFFKYLRTVSSDTESTASGLISLSAVICIVHELYPSGGAEHATAIMAA